MMYEKKVLHKTNGAQKKRTVESYVNCGCQCAQPDCNTCSIIPSDAYVAQHNSRYWKRYTPDFNAHFYS